ncbi:MAG: hypothetical protein JWP89_1057 [Schlesneria sp.]|nr:hypothetical protein [Schlesneria sp.]
MRSVKIPNCVTSEKRPSCANVLSYDRKSRNEKGVCVDDNFRDRQRHTPRNVYSESVLKDSQERDEILLLLSRQFQFENQIKKLHRVVESQ